MITVKNKIYLLSIFSSLTFCTFAHAQEFRAIACPPASSLVDQIYNCGQNSVAVNYGQQCANALMAQARANGNTLHNMMEEMRVNLRNAQAASMADTARRLRIAIQSLRGQIENLQRNTDTVANYTEAMIDFAGATSDASSAECFSRNFHQLQQVVDGLDREIINSKRAYTAAETMLSNVTLNEQDMGNTAPTERLVTGTKATPAPALGKPAPTKSSSITGIEDDRKKRNLASPPQQSR